MYEREQENESERAKNVKLFKSVPNFTVYLNNCNEKDYWNFMVRLEKVEPALPRMMLGNGGIYAL